MTRLNTIVVLYWKGPGDDLIPELPHGIEFDYSVEKMNEIVSQVLHAELSVMIIHTPDRRMGETLWVVYINDGKFTQS